MVVHCIVVWLTGIQNLHILVVDRGVTVLRPNQAFHDIICVSDTACDFVKDIYVIVYTEEAGSRRGIIDTRHRHQ